MYDYDRRTASSDRSTHPTVVEYAMQEIMKKKVAPETAAKTTAVKHSGSENMFFGPGVSTIEPRVLTEAIYERFVDLVTQSLPRVKEGMGHFALDGALQTYYGWPLRPAAKKARVKIKNLVIRRLGKDPFPNDP